MSQGIGEILTYAVGVAIVPVAIIAVILMLFSARAKVNGPVFVAGWVVALGVASTVGYLLANSGNAGSDETASDSVSWGKVAIGVFFLLLAVKQWRGKPAPGTTAPMPKWMMGIDSFAPKKAFTFALVLAGVNPKNLLLSLGAGAALAQLSLSTSEVVVSLLAYIVLGSLSVAVPVVYYLVGGEKAHIALDGMKGWLAVHNAAVMTVLFIVLGAKLIGDGLPGIGG